MRMKKFIKAVTLALCLIMTVPVATQIVGVETVEAATKVKLNYKKKTIYVGDTFKLKITGTKKKVKWSSSDEDIAAVTSKGKVIALGEGTVKITAKVEKKKYYCKITVKEKMESTTEPDIGYDDCDHYEQMAVDGLVKLYSLLKDPSSLKINNISYGYSTDFAQPIECVVIDYNATNSFGGSVRGYCMVWYSLNNQECFDADCIDSIYKYSPSGYLDKDKIWLVAQKYL